MGLSMEAGSVVVKSLAVGLGLALSSGFSAGGIPGRFGPWRTGFG